MFDEYFVEQNPEAMGWDRMIRALRLAPLFDLPVVFASGDYSKFSGHSFILYEYGFIEESIRD